jgi:transposase
MNVTENQPTYQEVIAENSRLSAEITYLREELALLKRMLFGQKRERFVRLDRENQLLLDLGLSESSSERSETEKIEYTRRKTAKPQIPPSRHPLPAHLPRKEIVIEPKEDVTDLKRIGEQVTEELEYKPGRLYVNRYIRPKYARQNGEGILIGSLPDRPIEKGIPGPGLLSHILISKFVDHLPLYRQLQQFKREKLDIAQSTINDWVRYSCELLEPLYESQVAEILKSVYLMADETPIQVLDKSKRGKSHKGYFWVYYDPLGRGVFFDYRDNRSREGPHQILHDFKGFLQTDKYTGYDKLAEKSEIIAVGCFAHARRKFEQSLGSDPKRAEWMLAQIRELYKIERRAREKELSFKERYQLRQEESVPILKDIKSWLDQEMVEVLPKSQIGQAIGYMQSFWNRLERYVEDGRLEIDNNLVENAIRPVALGRKNYLFAGSHNGAKRAAIIYSLVTTAKLQNIEPFAYLKDILTRIASYPHKKISNLLPVNWKALEA